MPHWWCRDVASSLFSESLALTMLGHYLVPPPAPLVHSPCCRREGNVNYLKFAMLLMYKCWLNLKRNENRTPFPFNALIKRHLSVCLWCFINDALRPVQTADQEGRARVWRAASRTAVERSEARGMRTQRRTAASVTSPARVYHSTRCVWPHSLSLHCTTSTSLFRL